MPKLVASTWNRKRHTAQQHTSNTTARLGTLAAAVQKCADKINSAGYPADGLVKGIIAAPEYLFSAKYAGMQAGATKYSRPVTLSAHDEMILAVTQLSKRFPRILIVPGTMAWKMPLDVSVATQHMRRYLQELQAPGRMDDAICAEFHWNTATNLIVSSQDRRQYLQVHGAPMPTRPLSVSDLDYFEIHDPDYVKYLMEMVVRLKTGSFYSAVKKFGERVGGASDMMFNTAWAFLNGQIVFEYHKQGNFHEEFGDKSLVFIPGGKSGMCQIEELRFGFEICLDHNISSLSRQARSGTQADIQVILSAAVNFNPANHPVRDGGYVVHSSTNAALNGVWKYSGGTRAAAPSLGQETIDGSDLTHWEIDISVHDSFALEGTFMADLPGRESKKWHTVQAVGNTFRSRG